MTVIDLAPSFPYSAIIKYYRLSLGVRRGYYIRERHSMLSCDQLRERIRQTSAEKDVVKALGLDIAPERLLAEASDQFIVRAFADGSLRSDTLLKKIHTRPIPEVGTQNIDKKNMGYELNRAFWHAKAYTEFGDKYGKPFGTSRLLRYLVDFVPGPQYYGSEVNPENIAWGKKNYSEVNYVQHEPTPPIGCDDSAFDIIYAQSIFSHYAENLHWKWLTELHRILAPGGLLMITKEGRHLVERCKSEPETFKRLGLDRQDATSIWQRFDEDGYAFYTRYRKDRLEVRGIDGDNWGTAFISEQYILKNWTSLFDILEQQEGAVGNRQDYVIMRRKG